MAVIGLSHLKTVLKTVLNTRTNYQYWAKTEIFKSEVLLLQAAKINY